MKRSQTCLLVIAALSAPSAFAQQSPGLVKVDLATIADTLARDDVPFILATGGTGDSIVEHYRDRPTLAKPFTIDGVKQALAALD